MKKYLVIILLIFFVWGCSTTKKVPEGSYLLDKVKVRTDTRNVKSKDMEAYLRQKPNSSVPVLGKLKLKIYNMTDNEHTWLGRKIIKLGEPPVLYSDRLTGISMEQIRLQLSNKGYLNAEVDTTVELSDKKAKVTYRVTGNDPYLVRYFNDTINAADTLIHKILEEKNRLEVIREGNIFDLEVLEKGRVAMAAELRNNGYYNFTKDNFEYLADTTVGEHRVDLTLQLKNPSDSTRYMQYRFGEVIVNNGVDPSILLDSTKHYLLDTVNYRNVKVISERKRFMLPQAIYYNTFIRPDRLYADRIVERTYSSLNKLGSVTQTSINLTPVVRNDSNYLDADIAIFPGNLHYMKFGVDGTHSAGDLGIATDLSYEHRNILKGGERLRVRFNGAYEFIASSDSTNLGDQSYYEYGTEVFLSIPQLLLPWLMKRLKDQPSASTEFSIGVNFQKRPEYLRQFFNLTSKFQWASTNWRTLHTVIPLDVNYVRMPWMTQKFRDEYLNDSINPILKASYEEQLIVRTAYNLQFSNFNILGLTPPTFPFRINTSLELAGHLPRLVGLLGGTNRNRVGRQTLLGIPYAEYFKIDVDMATSYRFDDYNILAAHLFLGLANPYGNSMVLPFEKRYFGGGANSVRGWSTRTLGPGTYRNDSLGYDFANKTGDIKLDMSLEFRRKFDNFFELAAFVDAGNVWTIKNYSSQQGGYFRWNQFYKQLAASYGLGLRIDLNFLLLRLDFGMKAHNPALSPGERWTIFKPKFSRDFAWHFAIGYPF